MPRKKQPVEVKPPTTVKLVFKNFDKLPDEQGASLSDLKKRSPFNNAPKPKGKGLANIQFNGAINKELNKGRALANALEFQHKLTFG